MTEAMAQGTVKNRVSELAGRYRMNIRELSKAAGISYQTAYALYYDRSKRIDIGTLAGLCEAFKVEVGDILYYSPTKNEVEA